MNNSLISLEAISDFAATLKKKGLSPNEISEIIMSIVLEVEMGLIEELMDRLSDQKKITLQQLIAKNVSDGEIAKELELNEKEMQEIEMKKFSEIVQRLSPFLNFE